jgi:hypothetical protein
VESNANDIQKINFRREGAFLSGRRIFVGKAHGKAQLCREGATLSGRRTGRRNFDGKAHGKAQLRREGATSSGRRTGRRNFVGKAHGKAHGKARFALLVGRAITLTLATCGGNGVLFSHEMNFKISMHVQVKTLKVRILKDLEFKMKRLSF